MKPIKFQDDTEVKLWCTIYSGTCSVGDDFQRENPAAIAADLAIREFRARVPENMKPGGQPASPNPDEEPPHGGPYHNSPVLR